MGGPQRWFTGVASMHGNQTARSSTLSPTTHLVPFHARRLWPQVTNVLVNFVRLCCFGDTLTGVCQSEHPINTEWSAHLISVPLEVALSFYGIYADKRAYNSDDSPVFAHEPGVQRGPDGEWVSYACNGSELAACVCIKGILWTQSMA